MVIVIKMKTPSLNDSNYWCKGNKIIAIDKIKALKQEINQHIEQLPNFDKPIRIQFCWVKGSEKRNLDNILIAKKIILDTMVEKGKLTKENRKCETKFKDKFDSSNETMIYLVISEERR